jgi:hypothetical protein
MLSVVKDVRDVNGEELLQRVNDGLPLVEVC